MRLRLTLLLLALAPAANAADWQPKSSCFQAVRWDRDKPIVRFAGAWWELISLQGKKPKAILAFCRKQYGEKWRKRFVEDLGQVLNEMGVARAERGATLVLQGLADDKEQKTVEGAMTYALRQQAKDAGNDLPYFRIKRAHGAAAEPFANLAKRIKPDFRARGKKISAADAASDLDELEGLLEGCYSYLKRIGVDYRAALDTIRAGLGDGIERATFELQLRKFLALFGDGHSDVSGSLGAMGGRLYASFLFGDAGGRIFAFKSDRSGLVDEEHPYVASIDDEPIEKWLDAAKAVVPRGSPQFVRRLCVRNLRYLAYLRQELGLRYRQSFYVELTNADKSSKTRQRLELTPQRHRYGEWPRTKTRVLDGKVGYLRIPAMRSSRDWLRELEKTMESFKDTRGLVIDVRGNGGGSRAAMRRLAAYFMTDKEPPRIANIAAYRLPAWEGKERKQGHLDNRWLYPVTWPGWSETARAAIGKSAAGFKPAWKLPKKGFTKWHYMALDRKAAEAPYVYRERVVILMNAGCFSATDIFLGAFKGWPGVTLVGTPSGGGSGRTRQVALAASGIRLTLSSMASFRPDGTPYDGYGVPPDVVVSPEMGYFVGQSDGQLEAALKQLR